MITPMMYKDLDRRWADIQSAGPDLGVRSLFSFAHAAVQAGSHGSEIEEAYRIAIELQDRAPASPTYGNFRWYRKNERPQDLNAVEFCTAVGVLTWNGYRDHLSDDGRSLLEDLLRMNAIGIRGHKVLVTYTNIFVKKSWNAIALGEALQLADLAEEGYALFEEWCTYTSRNGFHEYLSPTYYNVDLDSLEKIAIHAGRAKERDLAEKAIRHLWLDIGCNWFKPADRLGGAHSRDYDYLTGNSNGLKLRLETMLAGRPSSEGYLCDEVLRSQVDSVLDTFPRFVCQSWGDETGQTASQYLEKTFSIGSACASRHNMDKVLTVNFDGGANVPMMNLIMDGRGDPYGVNPVTEADGHTKSRHLVPFVASVQREAEVLCVLSSGPDTWAPLIAPRPKDPANPLQTTGLSFDASGRPTKLYTHLVLPLEATVSFEETIVSGPVSPAAYPISPGAVVLVQYRETAVALRTIHASRTDGQPAPLDLVVDKSGIDHGVMRLTWTHADAEPDGRGTLVIRIKVAGQSEADELRRHVSEQGAVDIQGHRIDVSIEGTEGAMRIVADCDTGERIRLEGADPALDGAVLSVNGTDMGKSWLIDQTYSGTAPTSSDSTRSEHSTIHTCIRHGWMLLCKSR